VRVGGRDGGRGGKEEGMEGTVISKRKDCKPLVYGDHLAWPLVDGALLVPDFKPLMDRD
jgi:hypothetical protein